MCASPYYKEQAVGEWFVFVSMTAFWVSLVFLVMYLIHAMEKFHVIPWLMIEFGFCGLWTFFYFSAALAAAVEVSTGCHVVCCFQKNTSAFMLTQPLHCIVGFDCGGPLCVYIFVGLLPKLPNFNQIRSDSVSFKIQVRSNKG